MSLKYLRHYALALLCAIPLALLPYGAIAAVHPALRIDQATHPNVMQQAGAQVAAGKTDMLSSLGHPAAIPTALGGAGGPQREVFGFALASSLADPTVGYPSWDFSMLSTVAFFGLHVQDDGSFAGDAGWTSWNSADLTNLVSTAHSRGTRVVLTIILQDFAAGTPHMCAGLAHGGTTVAQTIAQLKAKGVDGVNVDYEGLNGSCGTGDSSYSRHQFTNFVGSLRSSLPAGSYLSVDTYASSASDPIGFFDIGGLAPVTDSFFVMAYDLEYSNYARPPLNCSSFCLSPTAPLTGYYYNDISTVNQYVQLTPPSKVILGVPYYGRKSCVAGATPSATPTGSVVADTYLDAVGESTAPGVQPGSFAMHRDANDGAGKERWDTWVNTTMNCTRELYWDDVTSLGAKYDLVNNSNLRGVGLWNLNYGGGATELWQLLAAKFGTTTPWHSLGGIASYGPGASSWGASRTDVFVRGSDNGLWLDTWNGTGWGPWSSLGGILTSGPSAVSWGANRIDAFARGTDNGLWHAWWDGTRWNGWQSLGGVLTSGPGTASLASARLDVFVRGSDNGLWHLWWNPTSGWSTWQPLGGILTSDPSAVASSSTHLEVFARGTDNGLWRIGWDGATGWGKWQSLGGILTSRPVATSCASGHLDVFATGTDSAMYRLGFNGTWGSWQRLGGVWSSDPGAVCPTGTTSVNLFDRASDGSVWYTNITGS
jgi:spore germination protein YaaH